MSFGLIQIGFLFGLLALAIPIVIHLMFRRRPRTVELGSIRFLQEIFERSRNRRRITRWILLALRMSCIALLAILFARPFLTQRSQGEGERFVAILIDRSASMQLRRDGRRLLDEAIDEVRRIIREDDGESHFEVAFFDRRVVPLGTDTPQASRPRANKQRSDQLLRNLTAPQVTYSATDYGAAFAWAHDVCAKASGPSKEAHIFTDLQQSGLAWSDVQPMPRDVRVHVHDLGRDLPNNVAIMAATPTRSVMRPGETLTVSVTLLNAGPYTLDEIPVALNLNQANRPITRRERAKLEPGAIVDLEFELPELEPGLWQGTVALETIDDLTFDNQRYVAVLVAPPYRVLVVDGAPHPSPYLCETYFLESALRLAPAGKTFEASPFDPEVVSAPTRLPDLQPFEQVVMANVGELARDEANRLRRFVHGGGGLIVFTGENVTATSSEVLAEVGLTPGKIIGFHESDDLPWRLTSWDQDHSIFQAFNDPQHGDLRRLAFRGYTAVTPADDARILAEFHGGIPLVVERRVGAGSVIWFLSTCDPEWGDWSRSRLFLPLVHQMLGYLTGLNEGGPVREVLIDSTNTEMAEQTPGVYEQNGFWQVVNTNPRESETDRCSLDDFVKRFELNLDPSHMSPAHSATMVPTSLQVRKNEVWHWVLFALVAFVCLEFFVANRAAA